MGMKRNSFFIPECFLGFLGENIVPGYMIDIVIILNEKILFISKHLWTSKCICYSIYIIQWKKLVP